MPNVIQIVPTLPPMVSGVGDYAVLLAAQMRRAFAINSHFVIGNPDWQGPDEVNGFSVSRLTTRTAKALVEALRECTASGFPILLHYAGYGYQKRGYPRWLVEGLMAWRKTQVQHRLVTMFHELFASGPPWSSSFWMSPLQKNLIGRLVRLSDAGFTSLKHYADQILEIEADSQTPIHQLPVFSTFQEPDQVKPLKARSRRLVVIGHHGRRALMYERSCGQLNQICERFGIEEMLDIGEPVGFDLTGIVTVPLKIYGVLPAVEISKILQDSLVGIFDYPGNMLGKSTVFAAYAAHRLIPIVVVYKDASPADGLEPGKHFWSSDVEPDLLSLQAGQIIADNAFEWYQSHNLAVQAKRFATCLYGNQQVVVENGAISKN
jgi:hypothetical protein